MGWLRLGAAILALVAVTGLVSVPGGLGGPQESASVGPASAGFDAGDANVPDRFDGPNDTVRVKVAPTTPAGNRTIREHVPVRHRFGSIVTTDVTREQYRALADHPGIEVRPVQRVRLAGHDPSLTWQSPTDGASVNGTVELRLEASSSDGEVAVVRWRVDGGEARPATYDAEAGAWTATWDADAVANGTHQIFAVAVTDELGATERSITVTVGAPGDSTGAVAWHAPGRNATLNDRTRLQIDAGLPPSRVAEVAWRVDDGEARPTSYNATSGYWEATLDPRSFEAGRHDLRAGLRTTDGRTRTATVPVVFNTSIDPPTVEWDSPDDGETVSGEVPIRIQADDPDGEVREVRWRVDRRDARDTYLDRRVPSHYEDHWNTTAEADGTYRLQAAAMDDDGAVTIESVTVRVDNSPTEPEVRWVAPTGGDQVANGVPVELRVHDRGTRVTNLTWQVDGGPARAATYDDARGGWRADWNASAVATGVHTLRASARTAAGGIGNATIEVTVDAPDGIADGTPYAVDQLYGGTVVRPRGGDGVDVAVIDTGVDPVHPDLRGPLERCVTLVGGEPCSDPHGHGTALAGVAVADSPDSDGIYGVAPDARLHAYRAVGTDGTGYADDVAAAIRRAADADVDVVVLGLRTETEGSLVGRAIAATREDVLFVAAAGNAGQAADTLAWPAARESVLAVGAIDRSRRVLDSSSRGREAEAFCPCRGYVDVVAAGDSVATTARHGGYARRSGTSIAAAGVAGVAAKAWAAGRADLDRDGTVTPAEVRAWIREHARDVTAGRGAGEGYDPASGAGLPVVD